MAIPFIDLCSGIGGFHSGLINTGHYRCVGHAEIDKNAEKAYNAIYGEEGGLNYGDLRTINPRKLPHFDLLCGGFPCQSFSVAGRRLGFRDTRGTVFFEIARILAEKRPPFLLLENVPYALQRIRDVMNRNQLCVAPPKSSETEQKSPVSLHIIFGFNQARTATQSTPYPVPNEMPLEDQDGLSLFPKQLAWPRCLLWRRPQW